MGKITLECIVCNKKETFKSCEKAFQEGWDCPPYFSYTSCPNCFITEVIKALEYKFYPENLDEKSFAE